MSLNYVFRLCFKDGTARLMGEKGTSINDLLEKLKPFLDEMICYEIKGFEHTLSNRDILKLGMKAFKPFCFSNADRFEIVNIETNQVIECVENN